MSWVNLIAAVYDKTEFDSAAKAEKVGCLHRLDEVTLDDPHGTTAWDDAMCTATKTAKALGMEENIRFALIVPAQETVIFDLADFQDRYFVWRCAWAIAL